MTRDKLLKAVALILLISFISCAPESKEIYVNDDIMDDVQEEILMNFDTALEVVLPKLPFHIENPEICQCSIEFDVCLVSEPTIEETTPWCTKKCDPDNASVCETVFGKDSCCLKIPIGDDPEFAFCFSKEACCNNCGELCCPDGFECVNNGEMCWPEFLKQCGDSYCFFKEVCVDGTCCPETLATKCGNKCMPTGCDCIDLDHSICLLKGEIYCGDNVICHKGEKCYETENGMHCLPEKLIPCGSDFCQKDYSVCTPYGCCPKELSLGCGDKCCYDGETCINEGEACLPIDHEWCNGQICSPGFTCSYDKKICYPKDGEYCGETKFCSAGMFCTEISCCLKGQKEVAGQCYPGYYECNSGPKGEICYPPNWSYCYETGNVCPQGEFCALKGTICLPNTWEECEDGHVCPPNLQCAGSTCCEFATVQNCGDLCCPDYWQCIENKLCLPLDVEICEQTGNWCQPPYICATDGQCMHYMWTDCGDGLKCSPDKLCAKDGENKKCCEKDQPTLCGDTCCYIGASCKKDQGQSFCIPLGAEYCGIFEGKIKWCSDGSYCGKKALNKGQCIPDSTKECENGGYCFSGQTCLNKNEGPKCCLIGDPECLQGEKCEKNNDCAAGSWQSWLSCLPKSKNSSEKYCMKLKQGSFCDDEEDCGKLDKGMLCNNGVCGKEYFSDCIMQNPNNFIDACRCTFDKECALGLECMYISSGATCSEVSVCGCPDSGNYLSSSCISGQSCQVNEYGIYKDVNVSKNDAYATEIYFIDSGEGLGWPHGPTGNMHVCLIDSEDEPPTNLPVQPPGSISAVCLPGTEIGHLPGPHPHKCEWFPNMGLLCQSFTLFNWDNYENIIKGKYPKCNSPTGLDILSCFEKINKAIIVIWESDTCSISEALGDWDWVCDIPIIGWGGCAAAEMICDLIRADDIMGAEIVKKNEITGQCGKKVILYRYTEDGERTDTSSGWIRIKIK